MAKPIRLQHRAYFGADNKIQYTQHRINLPDGINKKIEWGKENQITISVESRNGKKKTRSLELKTDNV